MPFIDLHCDTVYEMINKNINLDSADLCVSADKLKAAKALCQCFALYINLADHNSNEECWQRMLNMYELFERETALRSDRILVARSAADIERAATQQKTAALLTVEEGGICGESLERLEQLYGMGVRMITLTWNYENAIGFPNSADPAAMRKGLKPFGFEFIENMQRLGMIIDVSHLSEGGFWDVVKHSRKPFVASHSNAKSLCNVSRNLTDEQLKALANSGGVTGINFYPNFLGSDQTGSIEQMISHICHIKKVAGIDTVAIGSDFDGYDIPAELKDAADLPKFAEALQKAGFTADEVDKICWKNALRVFKEVL